MKDEAEKQRKPLLPQGKGRKQRRRGAAKPRRRGLAGQKPRRKLEQVVRRRAVAMMRMTEHDGGSVAEMALVLGKSPRTLQRWRQRWHEDHLALRPLGRPPQHAERGVRMDLLMALRDLGADVGVPTLHKMFPQLARGEIEEIVHRWRYAWCRHKEELLHQLRWARPGACWAADHSHPPCAIDNLYERLLMVRDLGSCRQLEAMPTLGEDGETFRNVLRSLCKWYGIPLVLKVDNGSAFISEETQALAAELGILILYSPPRTPEYNGAVEAGLGWIKQRAQESSCRAGRPGEWTCDDVERAVQEANETARPFGKNGPTPQEEWQERTPIGEEERRAFLRTYRRRYAQECSRRGLPWTIALERNEKASVDRVAISQALIDHGYLAIRMRRITAPFYRRRRDIKR